jgi:hypothetical protein
MSFNGFTRFALSTLGGACTAAGYALSSVAVVYLGEHLFTGARIAIEYLPKLIHVEDKDGNADNVIKIDAKALVKYIGWKVLTLMKLSSLAAIGVGFRKLGNFVSSDNVVALIESNTSS